MQNENPAMKLHCLLEAASNQSKGVIDVPSFKEVWCNVFVIEKDDTSTLLLALNSMHNLFFTTKSYIESNNRLNTDLETAAPSAPSKSVQSDLF
ncbi:MAG TPA: hypothetical protein GXX18_06060 [Bacillales bacterium]|nr:hypothetical protein [Bacillales bacterium]